MQAWTDLLKRPPLRGKLCKWKAIISIHLRLWLAKFCEAEEALHATWLMKFSLQDGVQPRGNPKCIVLCPTRELAKQVEKEFQASGPSLNVACLYGGMSLCLNHRNAVDRRMLSRAFVQAASFTV